jgi:TPP-dependent pyruvate/acetoin dehydrogenase alpha subunit
MKAQIDSYPKEFLANMYRRMVLVRQFELRAIEERRRGMIRDLSIRVSARGNRSCGLHDLESG